MPAGIFVRDRDGRFVLINRAYETVFGVTNDDVRGLTLHDVFPKEQARQYAEHDAKVVKEKSLIIEEATVSTANGEIIISSSKFPLNDNDGALVGIAGVEYDITEHKRAIADLEKTEMSLSESQAAPTVRDHV